MNIFLSVLYNYKKRILIGILALIFTDLGQLIVPQILKRAVNSLSKGEATWKSLSIYAIHLICLAVIVVVFRFLWRYFILGVASEYEKSLRNKIYNHLLLLSTRYFQKTKTGDLMACATNDIDAVRMAMGMGVVAAFDSIIISFFAITAMLYISPVLTLYAILPFPVLAVLVLILGRKINKRFEEVQDTFSIMTEKVRESVAGIRVLKAFVKKEEDILDFYKISTFYLKKNIELIKIWGLLLPVIAAIAGGATVILLVFGGRYVILGRISIGEFVAFLSYLSMMTWPMMAIGWVVNLIERGRASMNRIETILNEIPDVTDARDSIDVSLKGEIELRDLSFSYPKDFQISSEYLSGINLKIKSGSTIGIVGRTASGKTTIVNLLLRLWNPPSSTIFIDGYDILKISLKRLRDTIAVVPQDPFLFSASIMENINLGKELFREELKGVASDSGIYEEIINFPQGFDTLVGERGITLSGGQKLRIALARAIAKDSSIIILDDTFSQVDSETETNILNNLKKLKGKKTIIIISHKISSVKNADLIVVLDEGKILETGRHEELLNSSKTYQKLFEIQKSQERLAL